MVQVRPQEHILLFQLRVGSLDLRPGLVVHRDPPRLEERQDRRRKLRSQGAVEEDLEALFREEQALMTRMLAGTEHAGRVGAFEGAGYEAQGLYRPAADCIMFTRDRVGFCPVCRRAIERVIDMYAR